jgi:hypothetical protein
MKKSLFFGLLILVASESWAQQSSCAQTLRLATSTYEQGRLHELEGILANCLQNTETGFTKEERVAAYKLLTQAYIYLEEPEKADDAMLKLLQTDHYFEINKDVDPAEFVALFNTFRTREIYRVGAKLGVNATQPNVTNTISAAELNADSRYKYGIAILFGGTVDVPVNDKFTLHGELLYLQRKFELTSKVDRGFSTDGVPLANEQQAIETQSWLSLPLSVEYKFMDKKFNPFVGAGVSVDYLLNAQFKGERIRDGVTSIPETTFDFNPQREKINISAILSTGIKTRVSGGYFIAEVRYIYGITDVNSAETAYANQPALWEQGYADPVFKLASLVVSGSYVVNIFNPKKKNIKSGK